MLKQSPLARVDLSQACHERDVLTPLLDRSVDLLVGLHTDDHRGLSGKCKPGPLLGSGARLVSMRFLTTEDLRAHLARVSYRPGWRFEVYDGAWEDQHFVI